MLTQEKLKEIDERCENDDGMILPDTARSYFQGVPALLAHINHQQRALEWLAKGMQKHCRHIKSCSAVGCVLIHDDVICESVPSILQHTLNATRQAQ